MRPAPVDRLVWLISTVLGNKIASHPSDLAQFLLWVPSENLRVIHITVTFDLLRWRIGVGMKRSTVRQGFEYRFN